MLLAADIGNTNTVFAIYESDRAIASWRMRTIVDRTSDEYAVFISQLLEHHHIELKEIRSCIISSVVPDANMTLRRFLQDYLSIQPVTIGQDNIDIGVDVNVDKPEDVGADRIVNTVAVKAYYTMPAIVIDLGTATTFDVIDAQGGFCGGVIAPGISLSLNALHAAAAKLPKISIRKPLVTVGKNTTQAMQSGLYFGYVSLINGMIERIEAEVEPVQSVILTGGLSSVMKDDITRLTAIDEDLTLKGLMLIAKNNPSHFKAL